MLKALYLVFTFVLLSQLVNAQLYLGGGAGYCHSTYTGDNLPNEIYGWSGGGLFVLTSTYEISNNVGINISANIHSNNAKLQKFDNNDNTLKIDSADLKLTSLAFPIGVTVKNKSGKFYFRTAVEVQVPVYARAIRVDSNKDLLAQIRNVNLAITFGAGYYIPIGKPRLLLGVDYIQGLTNITSNEFEDDVDYSMVRTKIKGLRFSLGIEVPIYSKKEKL